jgi:hypothetical protein
MSDVINEKIQYWRAKAATPEGLSLDEMREAIASIRKERVAASETSSKSRAKKADAKEKAKPINSDDLLGELGL